MTTNNELNDSELDNLLDITLDDLDDLPSFKAFPAGVHRVLASFSSKKVANHPSIEVSFKLLETMELANENDTPAKEGDESSTLCMMDNEFGQGSLKKLATPFAQALHLSSIREVVEQVQEVECVISTSLQQDKKDADKFYLRVKELEVL